MTEAPTATSIRRLVSTEEKRALECPDDGEPNPARPGNIVPGAAPCGRPEPCDTGDCASCRAGAPLHRPPRSLLQVFDEIVQEREAEYGPPHKHWGKVAALANILFETDLFTAELVGKLWMLDKQVRHQETPKRDSLGDIAGYADGIDRIRGRR